MLKNSIEAWLTMLEDYKRFESFTEQRRTWAFVCWVMRTGVGGQESDLKEGNTTQTCQAHWLCRDVLPGCLCTTWPSPMHQPSSINSLHLYLLILDWQKHHKCPTQCEIPSPAAEP